MKNLKVFSIIASLVVISLCLSGCDDGQPEVFDQPFVYIANQAGASNVTVVSDMNAVNTYTVYLSSKALDSNLTVYYEVIVGAGLQPGIDFQLVTQGNSLTFLPGIYDMPIRVKWLPHKVDPDKDNTLVIRLLSTDPAVNIGYPGPAHNQSELVITKINQ